MKTVTLNNGVEMPMLGYGVYQIQDGQLCERCVREAIEVGYRSLDTAQAYGNEEAVGKAVASCGLPRESLFITSKIWISHAGYEQAKASIEESLRRMRMDYLDLMLIHQPFGDYYGAYRAMVEALREGKLRAVGVSNFYPDRFVDIAEFGELVPAVNQVETHVFCQQRDAQEVMKRYGTQIEAWGPFAEGRQNFFSHPVLKEVASRCGRTVAQVALRFLIQRGVVVIPKSTHRARMEENMQAFDFTLSEEDMGRIAALDQGRSLFFSHQDPEVVRWMAGLRRG